MRFFSEVILDWLSSMLGNGCLLAPNLLCLSVKVVQLPSLNPWAISSGLFFCIETHPTLSRPLLLWRLPPLPSVGLTTLNLDRVTVLHPLEDVSSLSAWLTDSVFVLLQREVWVSRSIVLTIFPSPDFAPIRPLYHMERTLGKCDLNFLLRIVIS